ncbi:DUF2599 domain-containing protein [Streptococcus respiraculi]|uniref:DUF2599 domain-containing protein n=1 Tax=Streptococcus respiraculi TaxID=2021971 RepID=UPI000E739794|nr:DUF2599 domain-containing protein [Streptococcus respiraculi]
MKFLKKSLPTFLIVLSLVSLSAIVSQPVFANDTSTYSSSFEQDMNDEHITQILTLAHSVSNTGQCSAIKDVVITEKDIQEFKLYYQAAQYERANSHSGYFKSNTGWVKRSDGITLSCYFYPAAMFIGGENPNAKAANFSNAFRLLKARHSSSPNWKNTASMEVQFLCHAFTIGRLKNPWNIEPWRTDTNLTSVIAHGCNP